MSETREDELEKGQCPETGTNKWKDKNKQFSNRKKGKIVHRHTNVQTYWGKGTCRYYYDILCKSVLLKAKTRIRLP